MRPTRPRDDAAVDLLDVLLRDGAVLSADVVVTVADVPLVGIKLRAAIAGMRTMTDHGMLLDLDRRARGEVAELGVTHRDVEDEPGREGDRDEDRADGTERPRESDATAETGE